MAAFCHTVESLLGLLGENRLALGEGYEHEVLNLNLLHGSRNFLNYFLDNLLRLLGELIAEIVDGRVQGIDLCLVAELGNLEIVSAVRVAELVDDTCVQLSISLVDVVFNTAVSQRNIGYRRLMRRSSPKRLPAQHKPAMPCWHQG